MTTPDRFALAPLSQAFASLGRAVLILDDKHRVLWAGESLDDLVCPGACSRVVGQPIAALIGPDFMSPGRGVVEALEAGGRDEGRRAFLRCPELGSRLVSVTVASLDDTQRLTFGESAATIVVMRPAEDDHVLLERSASEMGFVANSPPMLRLVHRIEQLQHSEVNVLVTGESGTGKELVARAIHAHSSRRDGPFVAVNCGAIAPDLLESELFGHVRGAFTGAVQDRKGRFEVAGKGTVFLDEIGDMPMSLQVKLLRVIQERSYERLGESTPKDLEARVIAATNKDLQAGIEAETFREDLYYRLAVVPIHIPPLRERPTDVAPLARHLLARIGSREGKSFVLSPDALVALESHSWPGNVRQLQNALEYAAVLCEGGRVHAGLLPVEIAGSTDTAAAKARGEDPDESELERIRSVLDANKWRRSPAAAELGMSRTTLWRKMREYGLE